MILHCRFYDMSFICLKCIGNAVNAVDFICVAFNHMKWGLYLFCKFRKIVSDWPS